MDDFYNGGAFLRRWFIDGTGQAVCPFDAVEVATTATADIDAILAANATVRERIEAVEAYEAAQRIRSGEQPPRDETYIDEAGEEQTRWSAAYHDWFDAGSVLDDATPETVALAEIRATGGVVTEAVVDPETGEPTGEVIVVSTPAPLVDDYVPTPAAPTSDDVNAERDRRLINGAVIEVEGYGPIASQARPLDQTVMLALKDTARDLIAAGVVAAVIPYRDASDQEHLLTATQMADLADKGKQWFTAVMQASWALKDAEGGVPADFTADAYWP